MRLHRFYTPEKIGPKKEVAIHSDELFNQIHRVFRLKTGDLVILFDGFGSDYECTILNVGESDKKVVTFHVAKIKPSRFIPAREIVLCAAVVKKDTFEWITEKATELGVTKIIPVMAERSEKKGLNEKRLKKIAIEASEQSGRASVPEIHPIITLEEAVKLMDGRHISAIAFHTEGKILPQGGPEGSIFQGRTLELFIGPEGGWSPKEVTMFHKNNIATYSLGNQILRTETAVVSALSLVMFGK